MRWNSKGKSADVEDRRGGRVSPRAAVVGGGGVLAVIIALFFGLQGKPVPAGIVPLGGTFAETAPFKASSEEEKLVEFVSFVLDDIQNTWAAEFKKRGQTYTRAKLVLFSGSVDSACGLGEAAMGPFYCPGDSKAYIDLSFYDLLKKRFGAPGDFAQAYVLAHEIGHHIQNLRGTSMESHRAMKANPAKANEISVRQELQADCLAGVWAHWTQQRGVLEVGDFEEALKAANQIGDDTLQKQATGRVVPESFTHGSAAQRKHWFKRGFDSGLEEDCDSFSATEY